MLKWRKMTWALIVWCAAILVWAIAGGSHASNSCSHDQFQNACNAGVGIGVAIILLIGFVGFVFLSIIWFMTRPRGRDCPACGQMVHAGYTICPSCHYDFLEAASPQR